MDVLTAMKERHSVRSYIGIVKYHFEIGAGKENFNWA